MSFEKVQIGEATLYCGDCLEILPTLPKVDAVVTDPPYCIGFDYKGSYSDKDESAYMEMIAKLKGRPIALLQYPEEMMRLIVPALGPPNEVLAWVYPSNLGRQFRLWGLWSLRVNFDAVKQPCKNINSKKVKNAMVASYDWWEQPQVKNVSAEKTTHPCQIPVSSVERVILLVGGGAVLDPFMGSGTTGVACANLGRKFIGIEIEPRYFDIACKRIEQAYAQGQLFEQEPVKPKQQELIK